MVDEKMTKLMDSFNETAPAASDRHLTMRPGYSIIMKEKEGRFRTARRTPNIGKKRVSDG